MFGWMHLLFFGVFFFCQDSWKQKISISGDHPVKRNVRINCGGNPKMSLSVKTVTLPEQNGGYRHPCFWDKWVRLYSMTGFCFHVVQYHHIGSVLTVTPLHYETSSNWTSEMIRVSQRILEIEGKKKKNLSTLWLPCCVKRETNEKWWHNYKRACVCVCVCVCVWFQKGLFSVFTFPLLSSPTLSLCLSFSLHVRCLSANYSEHRE